MFYIKNGSLNNISIIDKNNIYLCYCVKYYFDIYKYINKYLKPKIILNDNIE